jgi:ribosomal RNA-processing protein 36
MPLSAKLERKLQAFDDSSDGEDYYEVTDRSSSESFIDGGDGGDVLSSGDEEGDLDDQELVGLHTTKRE